MSDSVEVWLLKTGGSVDLALGVENVVQLLDSPTLYRVPAAFLYAHSVLLWEGYVLPILDPHAWLFGNGQENPKYVAVVAYQTAPMEPLMYGAIQLSEVPESIRVDDSMAAGLEVSLPELVQSACVSSFAAFGRSVLVPDLQLVFEPKS